MAYVIIIDDNALFRRTTTLLLRSLGHQVGAYEDGQSGLAALLQAETMPDVVLLDVIMPVMDGEQVLSRLSVDLRRRVWLLTALSGQAVYNMAAQYGVAGVLTKPVPQAQLVSLIIDKETADDYSK